jgi:hypothetical protein
MGGFVSLAMDKKRWDRKKGYIHVWGASLRARFESFGPSNARKARQQLSLTSTITCTDRLPYTKHTKQIWRVQSKWKKVIRSTKDNKAFYNLTKPLIHDFLISLGGHNMRKMHAKAPYHKANEGLKVWHLGMSLIELLGSHPCELQN